MQLAPDSQRRTTSEGMNLDQLDRLSSVVDKVIALDGSTHRLLPVVGLTTNTPKTLQSMLPELLGRDTSLRTNPEIFDTLRAAALQSSADLPLSAEDPSGVGDPLATSLLDAMEYQPLGRVIDQPLLSSSYASKLSVMLPLRAQFALLSAATHRAEHGAYTPHMSSSAVEIRLQNAATYALPSSRGLAASVCSSYKDPPSLSVLYANPIMVAHIQPPLGPVDSLDLFEANNQGPGVGFPLPPAKGPEELANIKGGLGARMRYKVLRNAEQNAGLSSWLMRCLPVAQDAAAKNRSALCAAWYALALAGIRSVQGILV